MNDWRKYEHNAVIPYKQLRVSSPPSGWVVGSPAWNHNLVLGRVVHVEKNRITIQCGTFFSVLICKECPRWYTYTPEQLDRYFVQAKAKMIARKGEAA